MRYSEGCSAGRTFETSPGRWLLLLLLLLILVAFIIVGLGVMEVLGVIGAGETTGGKEGGGCCCGT